jgi:hypothetical protein
MMNHAGSGTPKRLSKALTPGKDCKANYVYTRTYFIADRYECHATNPMHHLACPLNTESTVKILSLCQNTCPPVVAHEDTVPLPTPSPLPSSHSLCKSCLCVCGHARCWRRCMRTHAHHAAGMWDSRFHTWRPHATVTK